MAVDPGGSVLWVADREYQCLRKVLLVEEAPGYPSSELESRDGVHWLKKRYRPPVSVGLLGSPQGLAMDADNWGVLVLDRGRLYHFVEDEPTPWKVVASFPSQLIDAGPSGLTVDPYDNVAFVATRNSQIWRVDLATDACVQRR